MLYFNSSSINTMNLSNISAAIGIIGSLSSAIYLVFYFLERKKSDRHMAPRAGISIDENWRDKNGKPITNFARHESLAPRADEPPVLTDQDDATMEAWRLSQGRGAKSTNATSSVPINVNPPIIIDGATEFVKNELAYQDWLRQHPQGFVVNTYAKAENQTQCTILHKSGCGSIRNYKGRVTPGAYTEREYIKVCADDAASLTKWATRIGRNGEPFSGVCGLCKPPVPAPQLPLLTTPPDAAPKNTPTVVNAKPQITSWTPTEFTALLERCRALPPAKGNYIINDYVENVLLTVLDFMLNTTIVENAATHYKNRVQFQINDFNDLQVLLARFPDDKAGNTQVAEYLWGYKLWTRVGLLRRLLKFLGERGITTQEKLKEWAFQSDFNRDMAGKVKGIGFGIYKWLVMRQGVETIKPDIWVHRFVKQAVGRDMSDQETVNMVEAAAKKLNLKAYELDWRIWESRSTIPS